MITDCEDSMPDWYFDNRKLFPRFIIIRREQGSSLGGDDRNKWLGFVKEI
jgi:gluconate kinase